MIAPDHSQSTLTELLSLEGRVALVTGGARGIGEAIAGRLAEAGASVAIGDTRVELATATAATIAESGREVHAFELDVTSAESIERCLAQVLDAFGRIDILINNAGLMPPPSPLVEIDEAQWNKVMAVNVTGVMLCSRVVARQLIEQQDGGVILNLASTASYRVPNPGVTVYTTSKHAVNALTKSMALELGPHGIRVLDVAPTMVETPGIQELREASAALAGNSGVKIGDPDVFAKLPLGRGNLPDDIARVVTFCVSDLAAMMTGCTIPIDAGAMIR